MSSGTERSREAFVRAALAGTRLADVRWVTETGSTNDDLAQVAQSGGGEQVLITDLQTAGRGRRNRTWQAPSGSGVLMSVLIHEPDPAQAFWVVAAVSLAASETIDELTLVPCRLKWPNDVMLGPAEDQRKVAGVLAQIVAGGVVVGIGMNANWPDHVPAEMAARGTAISRYLADGNEVNRSALAAGVLTRAIGHLDGGLDQLRDQWMQQCSTLGQMVRIERESEVIVGMATDLGVDGSLQIRNEAGESWHSVGDVVHLRPVD